MHDFKDTLKKVSIGALITALVFVVGNYAVNNLIYHSKETEYVYCTVDDITKRLVKVGSSYQRRYKLYVKELNTVITYPKHVIKNMYDYKDDYIGSKVKLLKTSYYNKKNKLVQISYELH